MSADRLRVWLMVALLALLALGSFWIVEVIRRNSVQQSESRKERTEPDYFVEGFNFVRLSQSGQTNYRVTGDKLIHYPQEDEFEITQPRIVGIDQEKTPMRIRADKAIVKQKVKTDANSRAEDQIHLYDNVEVDRTKTTVSESTNLRTKYLMLLPDSEKMSSDKEVQITLPRGKISALGMQANNATHTIELLKKVHMEFEPTPRHK
ncbi:MAG: LPS export ABC transporter periplasmic protein LptC [Undibacterium sp.]|nr:LPS export ABC transporter periplasmic protein LptC [Undibacterium sp.]